MEIKFSELGDITTLLSRIAAALESLTQPKEAQKAATQTQPVTPDPSPKKEPDAPVPARPEPETTPKPVNAAPVSTQTDELAEPFMRKFAAQAVKKGLKKTPAIIKEITGGETRFAKIDPALYPQIHEAIKSALADPETA